MNIQYINKDYKNLVFLFQINDKTTKEQIEMKMRYLYTSLVKDNNGQKVDISKQFVRRKINGQWYYAFYSQNEKGKEILLNYSPYIKGRFNKNLTEDFSNQYNVLKVLDNHQIIDVDYTPLCVLKDFPQRELKTLKSLLKLHKKHIENYNYEFVVNGDEVYVYYAKNTHYVKTYKDELDWAINRHKKAYRGFESVILECLDSKYIAGGYITKILDPNGNELKELNHFSKEKNKKFEERSQIFHQDANDVTLTKQEFEKFENNSKGLTVLAVKECKNHKRDITEVCAWVKKYIAMIKMPNVQFDVQVIPNDEKFYTVIYCDNDSYKKLQSRITTMYAFFKANSNYAKDVNMFYYKDINGNILPIKMTHLCKVGGNMFTKECVETVANNNIESKNYSVVTKQKGNNIEAYLSVNDNRVAKSCSYDKYRDVKYQLLQKMNNYFGKDLKMQDDMGNVVEKYSKKNQPSFTQAEKQ